MDACERIDTKKKLHKWEILLARCEETISGDDFAAFFFFLFFVDRGSKERCYSLILVYYVFLATSPSGE